MNNNIVYRTNKAEDLKKLVVGNFYLLMWDKYNMNILVQIIKKFNLNTNALTFKVLIINNECTHARINRRLGKEFLWGYYINEDSYFIDYETI